jgi:hypothetical protein
MAAPNSRAVDAVHQLHRLAKEWFCWPIKASTARSSPLAMVLSR